MVAVGVLEPKHVWTQDLEGAACLLTAVRPALFTSTVILAMMLDAHGAATRRSVWRLQPTRPGAWLLLRAPTPATASPRAPLAMRSPDVAGAMTERAADALMQTPKPALASMHIPAK